jgi:hypothetical protein
MARRKTWEGPFAWRNVGDDRCVKCDKKGIYSLQFGFACMNCCREHAIEGMASKEGGMKSEREAEIALDERDASELRRCNSRIMQWEPVGESLPEPGQKVLTFDPNWPIVQVGFYEDGVWHCEGVEMTPTHWMELPQRPFLTLHKPEAV